MGLLRALRDILNSRDRHVRMLAFTRTNPFASFALLDRFRRLQTGAYERDEEPDEHLENAEFDSDDTPPAAFEQRQTAIEHERLRRDRGRS